MEEKARQGEVSSIKVENKTDIPFKTTQFNFDAVRTNSLMKEAPQLMNPQYFKIYEVSGEDLPQSVFNSEAYIKSDVAKVGSNNDFIFLNVGDAIGNSLGTIITYSEMYSKSNEDEKKKQWDAMSSDGIDIINDTNSFRKFDSYLNDNNLPFNRESIHYTDLLKMTKDVPDISDDDTK